MSREDIVSGREFPDGCVSTTWDIDLHYPKEQYAKKFPENPFISRAEFGAGVDRQNGYPVPYRCFYSTNVPNLFMAGRCISVTHEALGTVRVMRTCGMMGEVVGKAAYICVVKDVDPRGVYEKHLGMLQDLMSQPGAMRRDSLNGELHLDAQIQAVTAFYRKESDPWSKVGAQKGVVVTNNIAASTLPGIIVDDRAVKYTGNWTHGENLKPFIGTEYKYAKANSGEARFAFTVPKPGRYELLLSWAGHSNRATQAACTIERGDEPLLKLRLNQQQNAASEARGFHSLGVFDFVSGKTNTVVLSTVRANGFVHADCLQVLEAKQ
jgi:hypothetical protein